MQPHPAPGLAGNPPLENELLGNRPCRTTPNCSTTPQGRRSHQERRKDFPSRIYPGSVTSPEKARGGAESGGVERGPWEIGLGSTGNISSRTEGIGPTLPGPINRVHLRRSDGYERDIPQLRLLWKGAEPEPYGARRRGWGGSGMCSRMLTGEKDGRRDPTGGTLAMHDVAPWTGASGLQSRSWRSQGDVHELDTNVLLCLDAAPPRSRHGSNRSFRIAPSSEGAGQKWTGAAIVPKTASPQLCMKSNYLHSRTWIAHSKGSSRIPQLPAWKSGSGAPHRDVGCSTHEAPVATEATKHSELRLLKLTIGARPALQCTEIEYSSSVAKLDKSRNKRFCKQSQLPAPHPITSRPDRAAHNPRSAPLRARPRSTELATQRARMPAPPAAATARPPARRTSAPKQRSATKRERRYSSPIKCAVDLDSKARHSRESVVVGDEMEGGTAGVCPA
ncbi:hypothetical protein V494_00515 [Pseudogymnoascus sp. VKM F-4513 (FW-928)]|nr:hypothetical protein V494_00515 [Pseudogymnoascus sp. VKM F-4513 (FW-928)]